jgi:NADPH:quinone reductase-like Zn-dependent oxidoreductase
MTPLDLTARSHLAEPPERMWAAWIDQLGGPECIRYGELPVPVPGPTDVLVRVQAVAVNPVDTFVRSGAFLTPITFPFVIGRDLAGTVAAAGPGATKLAIGDRVWCNSLGHDGRQGAAAQYAVVARERLYDLPDAVDTLSAVAVAHPAATAHLALTIHARVLPGETVYIAGGAGHVGSAAVLLAARAGARVIASAREEDLDRCRSLGAHVALNYRDPELARRIRDAAPTGVDVHLDTSGRQDLGAAIDLLAGRGRIIVVAARGDDSRLPVRRLYTRDASLIGFAISNASVSELAVAARRINELLIEGSLTPRRIEPLPLSEAAEAHRRLETGAARGLRIVLRPPP